MTKKKLARWIVPLVAVVALIAFVGWYSLFREVRPRFDSDLEHFKYGSVGVEAASGAPYWIWYVLPSLCDKLPPGPQSYEKYGLVWEKGRPAPVGMPVMTVGFQRVGINCALCHTGTVRTAANGERRIVAGAPTSTFDLQGYLRFLFSCAESPKFNADAILAEIAKVNPLPLRERLVYRYLVIPRMKQGLLQQKAQLAWMELNPDWGPGRSDPFNPAKVQIIGQMPDGTIGNADAEPLWNQAKRRGFGMHWDGLNDSLHEIVVNSGIGNGASNKTIDLASLDRIEKWVSSLEPAPFPFDIDRGLAAEGGKVFASECAACHAFGGSKTGQAVSLEEVGTDYHRLASWSQRLADRFNGLDQYDWRYSRFRGTYGYMAVPLDGIWARAPYLHNGSVPYLSDLLKPQAERPATFYRGYDVYDAQRVGFLADGPEAAKHGWKLDVTLPGNSNAGHVWGTALPDDQKRALLEYLKTL